MLVEQGGRRLLADEEADPRAVAAGPDERATGGPGAALASRGEAPARAAGRGAARLFSSTSSSRTSPSSTTGCVAAGSTSTSNGSRAKSLAEAFRAARAGGGHPAAAGRRGPAALARARADRATRPRRRGAPSSPRSCDSTAARPARRSDPPALRSRGGARRDRRGVTALWQTDEVRSHRPRVVDEVRHGLWFFETSLLDAAPELVADLRRRLPHEAGPLRFGSWIGGGPGRQPGDRPRTIEEAAARARSLALTR